MRTFITGHKGYVGSELVKRGFVPLECDITNPFEVEKAIKYAKPHLVLHLAGKSKINWCEDKDNQEAVIRANVRGTFLLFQRLSEARIPGAFVSSDHVWRGGLFESHKENSKKTPPVNFYGMSKVAAESVAQSFGMKTIRTSYLFDSKRLYGHTLDMELGVSRSYPVFIRRSFMHLRDFCDQLEKYCQGFYSMPEVLHLSGSEAVSWYGFMRETAKRHGWKGVVKPRFREIELGAPRPWFGGLNTQLAHSLGFLPLSYVDGIERMKREG